MTPDRDPANRDPALERAWRAQAREVPPPALDRAILAAAHRAVGSGPQGAAATAAARRPQRWWMPLAAAATIGAIAIGVLQLSPQDPSLITPHEPIAAVAPRGATESAPPPAASRTTDQIPERDAPRADSAATTKKSPPTPSAGTAAAPPAGTPLTASGTVTAPAPAAARVANAADAESSAAAPSTNHAATPALAAAPPPPPAASSPMAARQRLAAEGTGEREARAPEPFPAGDVPNAGATPPGSTLPSPAMSVPSAPARMAQAPAAAAPSASDARDALRKDNASEHAQLGGAARNESSAPKVASPATGLLAKATAPTEELRARVRDPDAWIARIRMLRDEGRTADALRELRNFRDYVPDADRRLPADLRDWMRPAAPER